MSNKRFIIQYKDEYQDNQDPWQIWYFLGCHYTKEKAISNLKKHTRNLIIKADGVTYEGKQFYDELSDLLYLFRIYDIKEKIHVVIKSPWEVGLKNV